MSFVKNIERKNKLQLINELLTHDISIHESVDLFSKVKANFLYEMDQKQKQIKKESSLIDSIRPVKISDPNFDKPLNQIETIYEQVTADVHGNS